MENFQIDAEPPAPDTDQVMHVDGLRRQAEKDPCILKSVVSDPYHVSTRKLHLIVNNTTVGMYPYVKPTNNSHLGTPAGQKAP